MPSPFIAAAATGATGAGASSGGLFSGFLTGSNLMTSMGAAGMGMGLAQSMQSGGGYAPSFAINLSPGGQKLQKTLFETAKKQYETGLLPANLASIYIGRVKRQAQTGRRQFRGMLASSSDIRTGEGMRTAIAGAGQSIEGRVAPDKWKFGQREEEFRNSLSSLANIRNIELQTPILRAQTQFTKNLTKGYQGAAQGQAWGDIAKWLAMTKYPLPSYRDKNG